MKKGAVGDFALHFAGGALIAALWHGVVYTFVWWAWLNWAAVPLALGIGVVREWGQHRYDRPVWTGHRISEAAAWPLVRSRCAA